MMATSTLTSLHLRSCGITAECVGKRGSLATLILNDNKIGNSGAQPLGKVCPVTLLNNYEIGVEGFLS
jgi:hypothetical protein